MVFTDFIYFMPKKISHFLRLHLAKYELKCVIRDIDLVNLQIAEALEAKRYLAWKSVGLKIHVKDLE